MGKKSPAAAHFGPGNWATVRATGEHVKVEAWSEIAVAYRVRSSKTGLQFVGEGDLVAVSVHPEADRGRHWARCQAPGCGAPLTPGLPVCPACVAPKCTCGRCGCKSVSAAAPKRAARPKRARPVR